MVDYYKKPLRLRYQFVDKANLRKKRCGCLEMKIQTYGSSTWVQYADGMCSVHLKEYLKDYNKQQKMKTDLMIAKAKKTSARKAKREKRVEEKVKNKK